MSYSHFTLEKRLTLERLYGRLSLAEMARCLGVHKSSVSRELARNGCKSRYDGYAAHRYAMKRKKRGLGVDQSNRLLLKHALTHLPAFEWKSRFEWRKKQQQRKYLPGAVPFFVYPRLRLASKWIGLNSDQKRRRARFLRRRRRTHGLENQLRRTRERYWEPYYQRLKTYRYLRFRWRGIPGVYDPLGLFRKLVLRPCFPQGYRRKCPGESQQLFRLKNTYIALQLSPLPEGKEGIIVSKKLKVLPFFQNEKIPPQKTSGRSAFVFIKLLEAVSKVSFKKNKATRVGSLFFCSPFCKFGYVWKAKSNLQIV